MSKVKSNKVDETARKEYVQMRMGRVVEGEGEPNERVAQRSTR